MAFIAQNERFAVLFERKEAECGLHSQNQYASQTYNHAAKAIRESHVLIRSGSQAKKEIKGIGEACKQIIDEFLKLEAERERLRREQPLAPPPPPPPTSFRLPELTLSSFLQSINLSQYEDKFIENGFDNVLALCRIEEEDLDAMGIEKRGHKRAIIEASMEANRTRTMGSVNNSIPIASSAIISSSSSAVNRAVAFQSKIQAFQQQPAAAAAASSALRFASPPPPPSPLPPTLNSDRLLATVSLNSKEWNLFHSDEIVRVRTNRLPQPPLVLNRLSDFVVDTDAIKVSTDDGRLRRGIDLVRNGAVTSIDQINPSQAYGQQGLKMAIASASTNETYTVRLTFSRVMRVGIDERITKKVLDNGGCNCDDVRAPSSLVHKPRPLFCKHIVAAFAYCHFLITRRLAIDDMANDLEKQQVLQEKAKKKADKAAERVAKAAATQEKKMVKKLKQQQSNGGDQDNVTDDDVGNENQIALRELKAILSSEIIDSPTTKKKKKKSNDDDNDDNDDDDVDDVDIIDKDKKTKKKTTKKKISSNPSSAAPPSSLLPSLISPNSLRSIATTNTATSFTNSAKRAKALDYTVELSMLSSSPSAADAAVAAAYLGAGTGYIPRFRSGGWGILVSMHLQFRQSDSRGWLSRLEIIEHAQPHCDHEFVKGSGAAFSGSADFYTAWSSMKTLIKNEIVVKKGSTKFALTSPVGFNRAKLVFDKYVDSGCDGHVAARTHLLQSGLLSTTEVAKLTRFTSSISSSEGKKSSSSPGVLDFTNVNKSNGDDCDDFNGNLVFPMKPLFRSNIVNNDNNNSNRILVGAPVSSASTLALAFNADDDGRILLVLDHREQNYTAQRMAQQSSQSMSVAVANNRDISKQLNELQVPLRTQNLMAGDCCWVLDRRRRGTADQYNAGDGEREQLVLDFIVERKTWMDVEASVNDGRYTDQRGRLARSCVPNVIYVIEGDDPNSFESMTYAKFLGSLADLAVEKNFFVHCSASARESALYLLEVTNFLATLYRQNRLTVHSKLTLDSFNKGNSKYGGENELMNSLFARQLFQFKRIPPDIVYTLMKRFGCMKNLIDYIDDNNSLQEVELIVNIDLEDEGFDSDDDDDDDEEEEEEEDDDDNDNDDADDDCNEDGNDYETFNTMSTTTIAAKKRKQRSKSTKKKKKKQKKKTISKVWSDKIINHFKQY